MRLLQKFNILFQRSPRLYCAIIFCVLFLTYLASAIYHYYKPAIAGFNFEGQVYHPEQIEILIDDSFLDQQGNIQVSQQIFPKMLQMIQEAKTTIVLDMFLLNALTGNQPNMSNWTEQFTQALIQKRREYPNINIQLMLDPMNSLYGGWLPQHYIQLKQAGITIHETNLTNLRASNPLWTGFWAICCQTIGNRTTGGWLPSPFNNHDKVTLRSYIHLLNFRINHRKVMVVDSENGWQSLISSANIHDGSSKHRNVAIWIKGAIASDVLNSEHAVAQLSSAEVPTLIISQPPVPQNETLLQTQLLTEKAIFNRVMQMIETSQKGDQLHVMMFYLSERHVIQALKQAQQRGVKIQILLDKNTNAFGRIKKGIPNIPVAHELKQAGIPVKWCDTQLEQCHAKVMIKQQQAKTVEMLIGSANFTRRNLQYFNLESDIWLKTSLENQQAQKLINYFDQVWQRGIPVSGELNSLQYWQYRFQEWSGLSTF